MKTEKLTFLSITLKTAIVHTVTYFVIGFIAFTVFNYAAKFSEGALSTLMRPTSDPFVAAGPLFQPIRGVLFGIVFYLLRDIYLNRDNGWVTMWFAMVVLGIISTFGPAPGSIEGLIYTTLPVSAQLSGGLLEVFAQSFLLSFVVFYWVNNPQKRWISWGLSILFLIALILSLLGLFASGIG